MSFADNITRTVRALATVLVLTLLAVVARLAGPGIEGKLFPIITYTRREAIRREGLHVCWDTAMEKGREGFPESANYVPGFAYHPPHVRWLTTYCTDLPAILAGKPVTIDGSLYYRGANPLWLVPQQLPTIEVPTS